MAIFKDLLGQTLQKGQRFMRPEWNDYTQEHSVRYGTITEIREDSYLLLFDSGDGSKRGSLKRWNEKIIVNYEAIQEKYPENFL